VVHLAGLPRMRSRSQSQEKVIWFALGVGWLAAYLLACWVYPYAACPRCKGSGKRRSPSGKAFRDCRRCGGRGRRVRIGRRIWNAGINR
jgi:hypothetical protein